MSDFYEIDFLDVESNTGGDAICMRYQIGGISHIHVVDCGYQDTGEKMLAFITKRYNNPTWIDNVVLTHPDGDHAGGLRTILEKANVKKLWMLRPWQYADELLPRFARFRNVENLKNRLKEIYPNVATLEEIAESRGIPIGEPFAGTKIGAFTVLSPSKDFYLEQVVNSEKTPEARAEAFSESQDVSYYIRKAINFIRAAWGAETFSTEETSAENEMSVVQYARLNNQQVLLTGDAGRQALTRALPVANYLGASLPGIDKFQVPHHGSRRNLSTKILDAWLGPRLASPPTEGTQKTTAMISASSKDDVHPRKVVVRAMHHRGRALAITKGRDISVGVNAPVRPDYGPLDPVPYPDEEEAE